MKAKGRAIKVTLGPLIDDTDFKSRKTAVAYNAAGMSVALIQEASDDTVAFTAITPTSGGANDWAELGGGYYALVIDATSNASAGCLWVEGIVTGALPFRSPIYQVMGATLYDSFVNGTLTTDIWAVLTSGLTTVGSIGKFILDKLNQSFALQSDTTTINSSIATLNANAATILNAVNAITTNTARGKLILPSWMEIPDSGTATYEFDLNIYSLEGQLEAPDAAPTIHARKADGTSLDSLLASTTMTLVSTGRYKVTFSFLSSQATVQVLVDATWTVGGVSFAITGTSPIVDAETITTLLAIKAKTDNLPAQPAATGDQMDLVNAPNSTAIAAIQSGLPASVASAVWSVSSRTLTSFGTLVADTAAAVWNSLTSGFSVVGSVGKLLKDNLPFTAGDATLANQNTILAKLNAARINVVSPVAQDGTLEIVAGDDYLNADGRAIPLLTIQGYTGASVSGATMTFSVMPTDDYNAGTGAPTPIGTATAAMVGSDLVFTLELTAASTASLGTSPPADRFNYTYQLIVQFNDTHAWTPALGAMTVKRPA